MSPQATVRSVNKAPLSKDVFINCPFDDGYRPMFNALVFAIYDLGFVARCAREADDSGEVRIAKIERIIEECKFGIHDISEVTLDRSQQAATVQHAFRVGDVHGLQALWR